MNILTPLQLRFTHHTLILLLLLSTVRSYSQFTAMRDTAIFKRQVSASARLMMNSNGILGAVAFPWDSLEKYIDTRLRAMNPPYREQAGFEYPLYSKQEHLISGGIWVGAILQSGSRKRYAVSCAVCDNSTRGEMLGHQSLSDTFFVANAFANDNPARRFHDDDGDGAIDEDPYDGFDNDGDWRPYRDDLNNNGRPDHGEPNVDEDGAAISENDLYVVYRDSFPHPRISGHIPLGIRIWQKCYAWKEFIKEPIIPIEYYITNTGRNLLDSVYLGFYTQVLLGTYFPKDVGGAAGNDLLIRPRTYELKFLPIVRTAAVTASADGIPITPMGITLLGTSKPLTELQITYRYLSRLSHYGSDVAKYRIMSSGITDADIIVGPTRSYPEILVSVGPFRNFYPGDTLQFSIALVTGEHVTTGFNTVFGNAEKALEMYNRNFTTPNYPSSPPLRVTQLKNGVILDWTWAPSSPRPNPEELWEDGNNYLINLPDTHWRKRNPPAGRTTGGRVFEGYRVWRSENPIFDEKTFSLLYQYDVIDDLNFEQQTGIQYQYVDTPIVRGRKYWYAVTSFTIPDYYITFDTIRRGVYIPDTVDTAPLHSRLYENATLFQLPFTPSASLGEVKVVPNPYRTDRTYVSEESGWEGLGRLWNEYKRQIWFIHLPPKCTIRIFTIVGEVIATLHHDDELRVARNLPVGQEEWNLLSESNRAIASGIYVYLVESEYGTQTGKFVVIR